MESTITWKTEVRNYLLFTFKFEDGDGGKTYVVKGFKNEANWSHLKIGDKVGGLIWHDKKKKLVSADSPVYRLS